METIQVVIDAELLRATEIAARRTKLNRSALIRHSAVPFCSSEQGQTGCGDHPRQRPWTNVLRILLHRE